MDARMEVLFLVLFGLLITKSHCLPHWTKILGDESLVCVSASGPNIALGGGKLFVTHDGNNFVPADLPPKSKSINALWQSGNRLFAASDTGIFAADNFSADSEEDGGTSLAWKQLVTYVAAEEYATFDGIGDKVFAFTGQDSGASRLLLSSDSGKTWNTTTSFGGKSYSIYGFHTPHEYEGTGQGGPGSEIYLTGLEFPITGTDMSFIYTHDGGATWHVQTIPGVSASIMAAGVACDSKNVVVTVLQDEVGTVSTPRAKPGSWTKSTSKVGLLPVSYFPLYDCIFGGGVGSGAYYSCDEAATWKEYGDYFKDQPMTFQSVDKPSVTAYAISGTGAYKASLAPLGAFLERRPAAT